MDQFQPGCCPFTLGTAPASKPRSPSISTQQSPENTAPALQLPFIHTTASPAAAPLGPPQQHPGHSPDPEPASAAPSPYLHCCWCGGVGGFRLPWLPRLSPAVSLPVFSTEYVLSTTKPCIRLPASSQLILLPVLLL